MTETWALAALWIGLGLFAALASIWLRVATALSEIVVGTLAQFAIGGLFGAAVLAADQPWIKFLAGAAAIVLTFLAGAELDPQLFRRKWKEATAVGLISFFAPFLACAAAARWLLGWDPMASWLAGVAMSTTSVAVVYAVMIEFGFNTTDYGKTVLAACFVTDLGTALAGSVGRDHILVRRLRTLCFGLLTPFYFIRAGSFLSLPALGAAPAAFLVMLVTKVAAKIAGVYPVTQAFRSPRKEGMYTTLLMSTGLTFGTISSLFGLTHGVVNQAQYSILVAAVIASAVVPTLVANAYFMPRHLLPVQEVK